MLFGGIQKWRQWLELKGVCSNVDKSGVGGGGWRKILCHPGEFLNLNCPNDDVLRIKILQI